MSLGHIRDRLLFSNWSNKRAQTNASIIPTHSRAQTSKSVAHTQQLATWKKATEEWTSFSKEKNPQKSILLISVSLFKSTHIQWFNIFITGETTHEQIDFIHSINQFKNCFRCVSRHIINASILALTKASAATPEPKPFI